MQCNSDAVYACRSHGNYLGIRYQNVFGYLRKSCQCHSDPRYGEKESSWDTNTCLFLPILPLGGCIRQKGRQWTAQGRNVLKYCNKTLQSWPSVLFSTGFLQSCFWSDQPWASRSTSKNAVVSSRPYYLLEAQALAPTTRVGHRHVPFSERVKLKGKNLKPH